MIAFCFLAEPNEVMAVYDIVCKSLTCMMLRETAFALKLNGAY